MAAGGGFREGIVDGESFVRESRIIEAAAVPPAALGLTPAELMGHHAGRLPRMRCQSGDREGGSSPYLCGEDRPKSPAVIGGVLGRL